MFFFCSDDSIETLLSWETAYELDTQHLIQKNTLLANLTKLTKEWRVSFEFKPTNYNTKGYAQILHMTTGGKSGNVGDRTPALMIHKTKGVYIVTTLNGEPSVEHFSKKKPARNKWSAVDISQIKKGSKYTFSLTLNNKKLWARENNKPEEFEDVKVYASSNWYAAQPGYIRKLRIENMIPGKNTVQIKILVKSKFQFR